MELQSVSGHVIENTCDTTNEDNILLLLLLRGFVVFRFFSQTHFMELWLFLLLLIMMMMSSIVDIQHNNFVMCLFNMGNNVERNAV